MEKGEITTPAATRQLADPKTVDSEQWVLTVLEYTYPVIIVVYFFFAVVFSRCTLQKPKKGRMIDKLRSTALIVLLTSVIASIGQVGVYISQAIIQRGFRAAEHRVFVVLASILVWGCFFLNLLETPNPIWHPLLGCWTIGLGFEIALFALPSVKATASHFEKLVFALQGFRIACFLALSTIGSLLLAAGRDKNNPTDEEHQPLLNNSASAHSGTDGTISGNNAKEQQHKRLEDGWWGYLKSFYVFLPHLWPSGDWFLQGCLVAMGLRVVADRILNVLTPRQAGILVDRLAECAGTGVIPWKELIILLVLRMISSPAGYPVVSDLATQKFTLYAREQIYELIYKHVMHLSKDFHSNKNSGEIVRSMQHAQSVTNLIDLAVHRICPMLFDLPIALGFTMRLFNAYAAFIILVTIVIYTYLSIRLTKWVRPKRETYLEKDRDRFQTLTESFGNWDTISYSNRIQYEEARFRNASKIRAGAEMIFHKCSRIVSAAQSLITTFGSMAISILATYQISIGENEVGSFVTFLLYWTEILAPLISIATSYRILLLTFTDIDRARQLLSTKPTIEDAPNAQELKITKGRVEFKNVDFSYDTRKQTLKNISFVAEPGKMVAFVGETGAGKSTVLQLLLRFYDVNGGSIKIDGQDIRDVSMHSLRESIGFVPQEPVLFNWSITDNVKYARLDAKEEDIQKVCKQATVHDQIMKFPDQYESISGERGVKLSGGEKQRIAIARVLLKNSQLVLLDEATSSVDSLIEERIQEAFQQLRTGRTTFVVAHRLSTIMDADLILVVDNGEIIERGTHDELLSHGGKYFKLWTMQTRSKAKATFGRRV